MKKLTFIISILFSTFFLHSQNENSSTHRNLFLSTCCGDFVMSDASKSQIKDTIYCETWDYSSQSFIPYALTVNSYDSKGRMIESLSGYYHFGYLKFQMKYEFTYFPFDSLMDEIQYFWSDTLNGTGAWDNFRKYEYIYDLSLRLIEKVSWYSPFGTTAWQNSTHEYYSYTSNGLIDNVISKYYNANYNSWWYNIRHRYIYDQYANLTAKYYDYANAPNENWSNSSRYEYSYAPGEKIEIQQTYVNPAWINSNKYTHTFNSMGLSEEILSEMWNSTIQDWDTNFKEKDVFYYNNSGQLTEHVYMSSYIQWFNVFRETYTYDPYGELTQTNEYDWNHNDSTWMHSRRCIYISSPMTVSINSNEIVEFNIYPNPTSDYLNIVPGDEYSGNIKLFLMNSSGQTLKSIHSQNNDVIRIDASQFPVGVYFIRLEIDGKTDFVRKVFFQ